MALGEILLEESMISEKELEEALAHQKFFNGKTGTHLVELGSLDLKDLERVLSTQFGLPSAQDSDLEEMDEFCRHQIPVEWVEYFKVFLLKWTQEFLILAMTNPHDEKALQWLRENFPATQIKLYTISEIRFQYYLYKHFHRGTEVRIRNLFFRYLKERCKNALRQEEEDHKKYEDKPSFFLPDPAQLAALGIRPLGQEEELCSAEDAFALEFLIMPQKTEKIETQEYIPEFASFSELEPL